MIFLRYDLRRTNTLTKEGEMGIRRKPQMEKRLSTAIQRYHDHGPMFLVELEDEVERLRDQIGRLKSHVAQKDSTGDLKPAASGLGARLVAGLRG